MIDSVTDHVVYAGNLPLSKKRRLRCILNIMLLNVILLCFKKPSPEKLTFFFFYYSLDNHQRLFQGIVSGAL